MKYRRLTLEELDELRPEFINFLASNTVTADDWEKLKKQAPERANGLVDLFSDIVLEKVLNKISFVEVREKRSLLVFNCEKERIVLTGITIEGEGDADLQDTGFINKVNQEPDILKSYKVEIFRSEKAYSMAREMEVFKLLQNGGMISDGRMFVLLSNLQLKEN